MEGLPPELHHAMCAYLPPKDLPNYRLVSKTFASIGAARLFEQARFHATFVNFDRVVCLSSHAELHMWQEYRLGRKCVGHRQRYSRLRRIQGAY
jgi:hypothetical protein